MSDKIEVTENKEQLVVENGGVTDADITGWKNRHGKVQEVRVDDPDTGVRHVGYFKRPDMNTMQAVSGVSKRNEVQGGEILFDQCWLGGSPELKADAVYKMEGIAALSGLFGKCSHGLKNL